MGQLLSHYMDPLLDEDTEAAKPFDDDKLTFPQFPEIPRSLDRENAKYLTAYVIFYNRLSELCFNSCVRDFTTKYVHYQEEQCSLNCMEKYLLMNNRVSKRFHEFNVIADNRAKLAQGIKEGQQQPIPIPIQQQQSQQQQPQAQPQKQQQPQQSHQQQCQFD